MQPLQFQVKVAPAAAVPVWVKVAALFAVETEVQTLGVIEIAGLGVGNTVTKTVVTGEGQAGELLLATLRVRVLTPEVAQLN
jgi:hypothetical protein